LGRDTLSLLANRCLNSVRIRCSFLKSKEDFSDVE
jgi:hypothetical protein